MSLRRLAPLLASLLLSACMSTTQVNEVKPRPNINRHQGDKTISLHFGKDVREQFVIEATTFGDVEVTNWRASLSNGFTHAFGRALPPIGVRPDLVIRLVRAEVGFTPVVAHGQGTAARASIRYQANLVTPNDEVVRRTAGTVDSKRIVTSRARLSEATTEAIEALFETLTTELLER